MKQNLTARQIKERVLPVVCSAGKKESLLNDGIAYGEFLDMLEVCYLPSTESEPATAITTKVLSETGLTWTSMINAAHENAKATYTIRTMSSILAEFGIFSDFNSSPILVITNKNMSFGASAMTCPEVLSDLQAVFGDYYIIPSSVHEALAVPAELAGDEQKLVEMVKAINSTEVDERDRLADNAYHYVKGNLVGIGS